MKKYGILAKENLLYMALGFLWALPLLGLAMAAVSLALL